VKRADTYAGLRSKPHLFSYLFDVSEVPHAMPICGQSDPHYAGKPRTSAVSH
jgi:hypothetical protein